MRPTDDTDRSDAAGPSLCGSILHAFCLVRPPGRRFNGRCAHRGGRGSVTTLDPSLVAVVPSATSPGKCPLTSLALAAPAEAPSPAQAVVEDLSSILGRTVLFRDAPHDVTVRSAPSGGAGRHLHALPAPDGADGSLGLAGIELDAPVHGSRGLLGRLLVVADGPRPLPRGHLHSIDAAVALLRARLEVAEPAARPARADVLGDLLADDDAARRRARTIAVAQGWLHPDSSRIHAVRVGAEARTLSLVALGLRLSAPHLPTAFLAARPGVLHLLADGPASRIAEVVAAEAAENGVRVLSLGSASVRADVEDLRVTAAEASRAAELAGTLPDFPSGADADELGGWLLLASAAADPAQLRLISPAAHALHLASGTEQRRTIETYLDVGGSVARACELLFVHRTTLYYRLEKMPDEVRDALADGMKRSTLHMALKLLRLWEATGRV